jgi:hypothetical protein
MKKASLLIEVLVALGLILPSYALAQAESKSETRPAGWERGKKVGWGQADVPPGLSKLRQKREELERLRRENPQKFQKRIKQLRER